MGTVGIQMAHGPPTGAATPQATAATGSWGPDLPALPVFQEKLQIQPYMQEF